jgi:hypothetical protein
MEEPSLWSSWDVQTLFDAWHTTITPWFGSGKQRTRQRFVQEIENAVGELSQEPEWFDPVASFRDAGAFAQGPVLVLNAAADLPFSLWHGTGSEVGRLMLTRVLSMFPEVKYHRWQLFFNHDALSALLKELDEKNTGRDSTALCRELTEYWFQGRTIGSLHHALGSAKPLAGKAFTKLHEWHDIVCQMVSDVAQECHVTPSLEIASRLEKIDLHERTLYLADSLAGIAPKVISEDIFSIPQVELREAAPQSDDLLLYDHVLNSAVYTLLERLQLPNRSIVGIDTRKLFDATQWSLKHDAVRGELFAEASLVAQGVMMFYFSKDSDGGDRIITPEREPSATIR